MYCKRILIQTIKSLLFSCIYITSTSAFSAKEQKIPPELSDEHWIQGLHTTVSNSVHQSAQWFDSFFIDEKAQQQSPTTSARIRLAWLPKSRDWNDFETRLKIKMKLPHFQNKASIELSDDSDDELNNLPLESAGANPTREDEKFSFAFNYIDELSSTTSTKYRLGISGGDIFTRAKHKRRYTYQESHGVLIEPSIYYYLDDGLGAKLLLEYNYQISPKAQFRIDYSIRGSEAFSGIRWKHGMYQLNQIDAKTATILALQAEGERNGNRGFIIDKYTLSYRYRFNALREWLYFEVEPFIEFPEQENYKTTPGIALRIEGHFNKN